jgi:NifU-like protein involved in Fe-S cluster formation
MRKLTGDKETGYETISNIKKMGNFISKTNNNVVKHIIGKTIEEASSMFPEHRFIADNSGIYVKLNSEGKIEKVQNIEKSESDHAHTGNCRCGNFTHLQIRYNQMKKYAIGKTIEEAGKLFPEYKFIAVNNGVYVRLNSEGKISEVISSPA